MEARVDISGRRLSECEVRFSSDVILDAGFLGEWKPWQNMAVSEGAWSSETLSYTWKPVGSGRREVWVEVRDSEGNTVSATAEVYIHPGFAVVVAGDAKWPARAGLDHAAANAYRALRNLGFDDDHITYLSPRSTHDVDGDGSNDIDGGASASILSAALDDILESTGGFPVPLIMFVTGHGNIDFVSLDGNADDGYMWADDELTGKGLGNLLDRFPGGTPMLVIIGSCYSGSFITSDSRGPGTISSPGRVVITSTQDNEDSDRTLWSWALSSDGIWADLSSGRSVLETYIRRTSSQDTRHLWLDDNGDMIGHSPDNIYDDGVHAAALRVGSPGQDKLSLIPWFYYMIRSPGEIRVYDTLGNCTGLVDGRVQQEIPNSYYDEENHSVAVADHMGEYTCEVHGTRVGAYSLEAWGYSSGETKSIEARDIRISEDEVHRFEPEWPKAAGEQVSVRVMQDLDGDGTFERVTTTGPQIRQAVFDTDSTGPGSGPEVAFGGSWVPVFGIGLGLVMALAMVLWHRKRARP